MRNAQETIYAEDIALAMELKNVGNIDLIIEAVTGVSRADIENAKSHGFDAYPKHRFSDAINETR